MRAKSLSVQFSSVAQSCLTLQPHKSQHARPPCPSPTPGVHSDSRPSSQWCHFQSCLTLCNPVDCSPPGSFVHGILQTRILEWVAISFSRGSSQSRITPCLLHLLHWQAGSLLLAPTWKPLYRNKIYFFFEHKFEKQSPPDRLKTTTKAICWHMLPSPPHGIKCTKEAGRKGSNTFTHMHEGEEVSMPHTPSSALFACKITNFVSTWLG